jgi:hypothetical protein
MTAKKTKVQKQLDKTFKNEMSIVLRKTAELRMPKDCTVQQLIDRLELAKRQGVPPEALVGTEQGTFMAGHWASLFSLSLKYGELKESSNE